MNEKPGREDLEQRIRELEEELDRLRAGHDRNTPQERFLTAFFDSANQPVFLKDRDFTYLYVNREYERLAGVRCDAVRGRDDFAIFPEPVARLFRDQDEEVLRRDCLVEFEETVPLTDGIHTFRTAKFPLRDEKGRVCGVGGFCTDITSLAQANERLRESEERYASFIESFHGIAFRGSIRTFIPVYFHGAVETITGYREEDFLAGAPSWDKIVHPDDLPMLLEQGKSMEEIPGYTFRREYRIIRRDGETRWVFERGRSLPSPGGKAEWIEGTIFDITYRKNMEQSLRESEERYRTLIETASLGIQISDTEGRIILSNPAHHAIHEAPEGSLVGRYIWDFIPDEQEQRKLRDYYRHIIEEQPDPEPFFTVNRTGGDRDIHIRVDWNYLYGSDGAVEGICSIIHDISTWVWAEKTLKESEHRFRSVLESCPLGILLYRLEPDGRLVLTGANQAADAILSLDHDSLLGRTIEEAFPGLADTEIPERFREVCRSGATFEDRMVTYEDERIKGIFEVHAFQSEPGTAAVFFQDVTARLRMEEEVRKVQKLESVGVLAGGIAHDFNNLLTAVLGNISMAKIFSGTDCDKVLERLTDAENATLRARDLTQQLLTFSRGGAPVRAAASISDIVRDSTSFMLSGSNVRCVLSLPDDIWPVHIDAGQISQVFQNLVKNADQAMPEGGTLTVRAANVSVHDGTDLPLRPGDYVHLTVTDQGVGIHPKHLARIFDPYFTTKQEGSGLGLAACYSIIKNHDGLITVESEFGSGTTFHIHLPRAERVPETRAVPRKEKLHSGERILVMDDDEDVLNVAVNMLTLMGYKVEAARDGREAVARYREALDQGAPFDGVILDLTIPGGMGGLETVRQLLGIDPDVRAVVSSGYANDPVMAEYARHGFRGVVTKPYDMEHLGQVLRNLFD
ncbi:MAG: hypothetical protein Kow0089_15710 [Desulfobulbaceae bacterium]